MRKNLKLFVHLHQTSLGTIPVINLSHNIYNCNTRHLNSTKKYIDVDGHMMKNLQLGEPFNYQP